MNKASDEYETPQWLIDELSDRYGPFEIDVATNGYNSKCKKYFCFDSLEKHWPDGWFCNPPYSRVAKDKWIEHAIECGTKGAMVLPARIMSNGAFHRAIEHGAGLVVVRGRVAFELNGVPQQACPWPTIVLLFGGLGK